MKRALFIDRDGTLIEEPADEQIDSIDKFRLLPHVLSSLSFLRTHTDFEFVMVSNQDGLGTPAYPQEVFDQFQNLLLHTLSTEGITFDDILIDRSFPEDHLPTRKPGIAMLTKYTTGEYDLAGSYVIGDRPTDAQLARNLGCKAIILNGRFTESSENSENSELSEPSDSSVLPVAGWQQATELIYAGVCVRPRYIAPPTKQIFT